jgi:hypothetical protein
MRQDCFSCELSRFAEVTQRQSDAVIRDHGGILCVLVQRAFSDVQTRIAPSVKESLRAFEKPAVREDAALSMSKPKRG